MADRNTGLQMAELVKSHVRSVIEQRISEMPTPEAPEVNLTSYATVDTTAIGDALRALAPIIQESVNAGQHIQAIIAEAIRGFVRDDEVLARALGDISFDVSPVVAAVNAIKLTDYTRHLNQISLELGQLRLSIDAQTAAINAQTDRMEAATKATRIVSYDAAGRVSQIKAGK